MAETAALTGGEQARLEEALRTSFALAARLQFASHDPYDLLLSPLLRKVPGTSPLAARVAVQAGKRSGTRVRRLLRVPMHEDAKTIADYLEAAVLLTGSGYTWAGAYIATLARRLQLLAVRSEHGLAWGLGFPYASRFVVAPAGTPNAFVTTRATRALLRLSWLTGARSAWNDVRAGCRFLLDGLGSIVLGGRSWLRYWPGQDDAVVNIQASAAALFAGVGAQSRDERFLAAADRAVETVVAAQLPDGSWPYSAGGRAPFVDGFHTGFVLEGLAEYSALRGNGSGPVSEAIDAGLRFFEQRLLTPDGRPRAVVDGPPSADGQTFAQCVQTLAACGEDAAHLRRAFAVWSGGLGTRSRFTALRWTEAPLALAAATLLAAPARSSELAAEATP
jgi:hypothetical protein